MLLFLRSIYERHHNFARHELQAAAAEIPDGWRLDHLASACTMAGGGGWVASLVFVCDDGRRITSSSAVESDPATARRVALEGVPDARRMIEAIQRGYAAIAPARQTILVAAPARLPTLRPSVIVSLRKPRSAR